MTLPARAAAYALVERVWETPDVAYVSLGVFAGGTVGVSLQFDTHPPLQEAEAFLASLAATNVTPRSTDDGALCWLVGTVAWEGIQATVSVHHAKPDTTEEGPR